MKLINTAFVLFIFATVEACPYLESLAENDGEEVAAVQHDASARAEHRKLQSVYDPPSSLRPPTNPTPAPVPASSPVYGPPSSSSSGPRPPPPAPTPTPPVPVPSPVPPPFKGGIGPAAVANAIQLARTDIGNLINGNVRLAAAFLRLSFHDCVGGCDGCVDLANKDNTGLATPIKALQGVVAKYAGTLTRADVWALAGLVAVTVSQPTSNPLVFSMTTYNRTSCPNPTGGPARVLPSAHLDTAGLLKFFAKTFGFTTQDTVAIIGAHALGRALLDNSGFKGGNGWKKDNRVFDNGYYRVMLQGGQRVDPNFQLELQENVKAGRPFPDQFMWRLESDSTRNLQSGGGGGRGPFMLNADMAIAVNMAGFLNPTNGAVSCGLPGTNIAPTCPAAKTLNLALTYANNNDRWLRDFRAAFLKMTMNGYKATNCGQAVCPVTRV